PSSLPSPSASRTQSISTRGASPLGLPDALSRAPLRRRAPFPPPRKLRRTRRSACGAKAGAWLATLRSLAVVVRDISLEADVDPERLVEQPQVAAPRDLDRAELGQVFRHPLRIEQRVPARTEAIDERRERRL